MFSLPSWNPQSSGGGWCSTTNEQVVICLERRGGLPRKEAKCWGGMKAGAGLLHGSEEASLKAAFKRDVSNGKGGTRALRAERAVCAIPAHSGRYRWGPVRSLCQVAGLGQDRGPRQQGPAHSEICEHVRKPSGGSSKATVTAAGFGFLSRHSDVKRKSSSSFLPPPTPCLW